MASASTAPIDPLGMNTIHHQALPVPRYYKRWGFSNSTTNFKNEYSNDPMDAIKHPEVTAENSNNSLELIETNLLLRSPTIFDDTLLLDPTSSNNTLEDTVNADTDAKESKLSNKADITTTAISQPPSPAPAELTAASRRRGRPRKSKAEPRANTTATPKTKKRKAKKEPGKRSTDDELPDDSDGRKSRVRKKNRIAAGKCRSRKRHDEGTLVTKHEMLEDENKALSSIFDELRTEKYVLKNMVMAHANCDCWFIEEYLHKAASNWVGSV